MKRRLSVKHVGSLSFIFLSLYHYSLFIINLKGELKCLERKKKREKREKRENLEERRARLAFCSEKIRMLEIERIIRNGAKRFRLSRLS